MNIAELPLSVKDFLRPFAGLCERTREGTQQLDDLSDVVIVFAVFGAGLGVEEVVACYEFEDLWARLVMSIYLYVMLPSARRSSNDRRKDRTYHGSHTPNIRTRAPLRSKNNLRTPILSRLNIICKVVIGPTRVSKIRNLDGNSLLRDIVDGFFEVWVLGLV